MELVANFMMITGSFLAALYCRILANKVAGLSGTDTSLGTAINVLTEQVEIMQKSLVSTKKSSTEIERILQELTPRAEIAAGRLEILLSTLAKNAKKVEAAPAAVKEMPADYKVPLQLRASSRADAATSTIRDSPHAAPEAAPAADSRAVENLKETLRHVLFERGLLSNGTR